MERKIMTLILLVLSTEMFAAPTAGFFLPDSLTEMTIRYKTANNLIVLPVVVNDSIHVNLILDTGCRNMLLFGKQFSSLFNAEDKPVEFSGLGSGKHVKGDLALDNRVTIGAIIGHRIPIIVVPDKNLFAKFKNVHGVIGYEVFIKFEIEINFSEHLITFRPASSADQTDSFNYVPMKVIDSRPVVECAIMYKNETLTFTELLIDTGSSLGLIMSVPNGGLNSSIIGKGLNGTIKGSHENVQYLRLTDVQFSNIDASVIYGRENYASIGVGILRNNKVILNYPKSYVGFSKS